MAYLLNSTAVAGHQTPPFFKRGPTPLVRLVFFIALSLALLVVDLRFRYLEILRQGIAAVILPLRESATLPVDLWAGTGEYFASLALLREENAVLRHKQLEAGGQLLNTQHVEQENRNLRRLLEMKQRLPVSGVVVEILYSARDPFRRKVIINKGAEQGISAGQAVVDDVGVIGQVTRTFAAQAEVTLLTDKDQAISVQVARNSLRSAVFGAGAGRLELRFLAANADVQTGDVLVTSGLDGVFVPGLPVARVAQIDKDAAYAFASIRCEPIAGVERNAPVLVISNPTPAPPRPDQSSPTDTPPKTGKRQKVRD